MGQRNSGHQNVEESKEEENHMNVDMRFIRSNVSIRKDSSRGEIQSGRRRANYLD